MRSFVCSCSRRYLLPDVNICPFCKKDLTNHSDEYSKKHIRRCALSDCTSPVFDEKTRTSVL